MQRSQARRSPRLTFDSLEPRQLLAADIYETGFDPAIGATVNAFVGQDPRDSSDTWDIETGWLNAVDELADSGADQVNFSVYRQVDSYGAVSGGTHIDTVRSAVQKANERGLSVSLLPLFETTQGWRGNYNPSGSERTRFQNDYRDFIFELAAIDGVDRLTIASELNQMVSDANNNLFFDNLIADVAGSDFAGQIGVTANFDIYWEPAFDRIWSNPNIDFLGVSAYGSLIDPAYYDDVAGVGPVSDATLERMTEAWNSELDKLERIAESHELPVFIQEFGSVKKNYTSIFPWSVNPGDVVDSNASNRYADDPNEQAATYKSLLRALDGRGDRIVGVHFWSWEHQADRGQRSFDQFGGVINQFSIWPTDNAGGTSFVNFLATKQQSGESEAFTANDDFFSSAGNSLDVLANDSALSQISSVDNVSHGGVVQNADGTLRLRSSFVKQEIASDDLEDLSQFGYSVAIDENLAVVGAPYHDSKFRINNGAVFVYELQDDVWQQVAMVASPTDKSGDLFGWAVDIEGDTIVVGSMHDDMFAFNSGAAYVLHQGSTVSDWQITQSLPGSNVRIGDRFGVSVAIDGDLIAVGNRFANGAAINSGTVNLFRANEWRQFYESDIVESPIESQAQFGWDVDLHNQKLLVGAPRSESGSAFLYQLNEWGQSWSETELQTDSIRTGDRFGYSVAISEGGVFVGSTLHDHAGVINTGAVYRFEANGDFLQKLIQPSPQRGDQFGFAIDADDLNAIASGVGIDSTSGNSGRVVEFGSENGAWIVTEVHDSENVRRFGHALALDSDHAIVGTPLEDKVQTLIREQGAGEVSFDYTIHQAALELQGEAEDSFGWAIATTEDWAAVGAPTALSNSVIRGGSVWIFQRTGEQWDFHSRLNPSTVGDGDRFGSSVDIDGNLIVVGSNLADVGNVDAGAAYVFELQNDQWQWKDRLLAAGNQHGDQFGFSVTVDGSRIAVGAIFDESETGPVNSGTATIFDSQQGEWALTQTIVADAPQRGSRFGHDVSLNQNWLAVSSPVADGIGKAYAYGLNNGAWQLSGSFAAEDSGAGDEFGNSISIHGSHLVVGAWKHNHNGIWNSGAAYVFQWADGQWQEVSKLVSSSSFGALSSWNQFGSSVDLSSSGLAVGSTFENSFDSEDAGAVYMFDASWDLTAKFSAHAAGEAQGNRVALSGSVLISAGTNGNVAFQNTVDDSARVSVSQ